MTAFGARTVSVGQRGCFVEKEQLGVGVRTHDDAVSSAKLQAAGDPAADLKVPHDPTVRIVQYAAVAHQRAARGEGHDLAKRRHAIPMHTPHPIPYTP